MTLLSLGQCLYQATKGFTDIQSDSQKAQQVQYNCSTTVNGNRQQRQRRAKKVTTQHNEQNVKTNQLSRLKSN